jgi:adenylate cyclase
MKAPRLRGWLDRLADAGALPTDTPEERLRKATLTLAVVLITILATVWTVTYAALGLWLAAAVPFSYQILSLIGLAVFFKTRNYAFFRFAQLLLMLLLPFFLQWSLGGFATSGAVLLWAIIAPLGALMFLGPRKSLSWLIAFLALVGLSGAIDPILPDADVPSAASLAFFVLDTAFVSTVVYVLLYYFVGARERAMAALAEEHHKLGEEQERSERLLLNILPKAIADRLKVSDGIIADGFGDVSVLFADIVGFTPLAERLEPTELVSLLNDVFSAFDELAEHHGLEKIKTIGDGYMVAGGLPAPRPDHAEAVAEMALNMRERIGQVASATRCNLAVRIGIDTGPVVAGVIGKRKFSYDLWGDTVNTASRMEVTGSPGCIQVTERAHRRLRDRYVFEKEQVVHVKGKGEMRTYLLTARRTEPLTPTRA